MTITITTHQTDDGTPCLIARAPGMSTIYAYPVNGWWVARLHDGQRPYETEAGCRLGMAASMRRSARAVLPVSQIVLDALTDIASGHNDPRARAIEALDTLFPVEDDE